MPDVEDWLDSFDPLTYRELLASEALDPDPTERLIATLQLGFSVLASALNCVVAGVGAQAESITPDMFDPFAKSGARRNASRGSDSATVRCGPNQMRTLMSGMVSLIT